MTTKFVLLAAAIPCLALGAALTGGMIAASASAPPSDGVVANVAPNGGCDTRECAEQADRVRRSQLPAAQPIDPAQPWISEDEAIDRARSVATDAAGAPLDASAQAQLPVAAVSLTMGELQALGNGPGDPLIAKDRPLWVLRVDGHLPVETAPGQAARIADIYTMILDAPTGTLVGMIIGADGTVPATR